MIGNIQWWGWDRQIAIAVTEPGALHRAEMLVRGAVAESEAACALERGDAEIHAVNLAQGIPVTTRPRLAEMLRSALWVARMTGGSVSPVGSDDADLDVEATPPIHPLPTYLDVQLDGTTVTVPFGLSFDLSATAHADTADYAAALVADSLECGVLVRIGEVSATAGHCPAGGWQVPLPDRGGVELPTGTAMASRTGTTGAAGRVHGGDADDGYRWRAVSVMAQAAVWADAAAATALHRGIGAVSWLEQFDLPARLVDTRGRIHTTAGWSDPKAA